MSTTEIGWRAGAAGGPCPLCDTITKNCCATVDGMHMCRLEKSPDLSKWKPIPPESGADSEMPDSAGFYHYRQVGDERGRTNSHAASGGSAGNNGTHTSTSAPKAKRKEQINWADKATKQAEMLREKDKEELSRLIGLPVSCFAAIPLLGANSWGNDGTTFTFPEHNGKEKVSCIVQRIPTPPGVPVRKEALKNGNRGLTLPQGWRDKPGPLFIDEGATDTLAMCAAGLNAIGRPLNSGGCKELGELLKSYPPDREIIVLGENDRKPDGQWPGRDGALLVAGKLSDLLGGRSIRVAMPPPPAKDVRDWLTAPERCSASWEVRGAELLALLTSPLSAPPPTAGKVKKRILSGFNEFEVNSQAIAALADHDGTFTRGGVLVGVSWQEAKELKNCEVHVPAGPKIATISKATLRERLTVVADWKEEHQSTNGPFLTESRPPIGAFRLCSTAAIGPGSDRSWRSPNSRCSCPMARSSPRPDTTSPRASFTRQRFRSTSPFPTRLPTRTSRPP
jgi:hypothetical protein